MISPEASQQGAVYGPLHHFGLALQLGPKANWRPSGQLGHCAAGVYRVESTVRAECCVLDVLEKGSDSPGIEVNCHNVVLAVHRVDQTLLGIGANSALDGRDSLCRSPSCRIQGGDPVQGRQASLFRDAEDGDSGNAT